MPQLALTFAIIDEDLLEITLADIWGIHNKDTEPLVPQPLQKKAIRSESFDRNWEKSRLAHPDNLAFHIEPEISKRLGAGCRKTKPCSKRIVI